MVEAKSDTGHFLYLKLYLEVFWKVLETQPVSSNITWGKEKKFKIGLTIKVND